MFRSTNPYLFFIGMGIPVMKVVSAFSYLPFASSLPYVGLGIYSLFRQNKLNFTHLEWFLFLLFFFSTFGLLTCTYSDAPSYGLYKSCFIFFYGFVLVLLSSKGIQSQNDISSLFAGIAVGSGIFMLAIAMPLLDDPSITRFTRLSLGDENPIITAQQLGLSALIFFWLGLQRKSWLLLTMVSVLSVVSFALMVLSGSKGPIIALLCSVLLLALISRSKKAIVTVVALFAIGLVGFLAVGDFISEDFFTQRFDYSDSNSVDSRLSRFLAASDGIAYGSISSNLFGFGSGGFAYLFSGNDQRSFPHNVFLEVMYEYGLLGVLLYFGCLLTPMAAFVKQYRNKTVTATGVFSFISLFYLLICAQFSGDTMSNWLVFFYCLLIFRSAKETCNTYHAGASS